MKIIIVLCSITLLLLPFTALAQVDFCEGNFDYDADVDGTDAFTFKSDFGRSGISNPCPPDGPAPEPQTGQTLCYDSDGIQRDCTGTGEDGEYQKGVSWPNPRFTDHFDGTVTDNLTGLMWTKDAQQISGTMTWQAALDACNSLDYAGYDDWRLPNLREMQSVVDYGQYPVLPPGHPFINTALDVYWTSSSRAAASPAVAWIVNLSDGYIGSYNKSTGNCYVWPVRGGQ